MGIAQVKYRSHLAHFCAGLSQTGRHLVVLIFPFFCSFAVDIGKHYHLILKKSLFLACDYIKCESEIGQKKLREFAIEQYYIGHQSGIIFSINNDCFV